MILPFAFCSSIVSASLDGGWLTPNSQSDNKSGSTEGTCLDSERRYATKFGHASTKRIPLMEYSHLPVQ
jgi:hypothetical protein